MPKAHQEPHRIKAIGWLRAAVLGGLAARVGGAKVGPGELRVVFWSALSMGVASAVGAIFGAS